MYTAKQYSEVNIKRGNVFVHNMINSIFDVPACKYALQTLS
jgi:hypothetical protein